MTQSTGNPAPPLPGANPNPLALTWMILSQLLMCLLLAGLAFFIWFAIQVGGTPEALNIGMVMLLCPFSNILFAIAAWVAYVKQKIPLALALTTLPLVLFCLEAAVYLGMMTGLIPSP